MSSWRDTLFLWDGELVVTPSKTKNTYRNPEEAAPSRADKNNNDSECMYVTGRVSWSGGWVGSPCPDARAVPVPLRSASHESSDTKFSVNGTIAPMKVKKKERDVIMPINSPKLKWRSPHILSLCEGEGWDLWDGDEKAKHHDFVHNIFLYAFDAFPQEGDFGNFKLLPVVGIGNNEYGHFVSAGYVHGRSLILGRRYLAEGDIREKWDLEMLFSEIEKSFPDLIRYCCDVRCYGSFKPPWRSMALHSQVLRSGKRKHGEPEPILAYMHAPKIDTSLCDGKKFEADMKVVSSRGCHKNAKYICSPPKSLLWEDQCWSCGGHCERSYVTISFEVSTLNKDQNDYSHNFLKTEFCGDKCAVNFLPNLVFISREFLRLSKIQGDNECFLEFETEQSEFWEALKKHPSACSKLEEVGWKIKKLGAIGYNSMVLEMDKTVDEYNF